MIKYSLCPIESVSNIVDARPPPQLLAPQGSEVGRGGGLRPIESVSSTVDDRLPPQLLAPAGEWGGQRRRGERRQGSRAGQAAMDTAAFSVAPLARGGRQIEAAGRARRASQGARRWAAPTRHAAGRREEEERCQI
jgi:hypothetical protein